MKTIKGKMLLMFGTTIVILLLTLGLAMSRMIHHTVVPLIKESTEQIVVARAGELGHWIHSHIQCINNLSQMSVFREGDIEQIQGYLTLLKKENSEDLELLFYADSNGDYYTSQGQVGNIAHRDYFQRLMSGEVDRVVTNPLISNSTGHPIFVIAHVVENTASQRSGIVASTITLDTLSKISGDISMKDGGFGWVVDGSGMMISHSDASLRMAFNVLESDAQGFEGLVEIGKRMISGHSGVNNHVRPDGTKMVTAYHSIPNAPGWSLAVSITERDLLHRANRLSQRIAMLMLSILLAVIILIDIISDFISRPLSIAVNHLKSIAAGDFSVQLPEAYLTGRHEIGDLTRGIDSMQHSLESLIDRTRYLAYHDDLTGLPNRMRFMQRLERLQASTREVKRKFGVLFIDLDNFKDVNDTMGHSCGDILLKDVTHVLTSVLEESRKSGEIFRYGGDEFLFLIHEVSGASTMERISDMILQRFKDPMYIMGQEFYISVSIGGVIYPDHGDTAEVLLQRADTAMYTAKAGGKSRFCLFEGRMNERITQRLDMEKSTRKAIAKNEFFLCYQPIISAKSGRITGVEALIRWQHPFKGLISPLDFIPLAEETGMIEQIGELVIREACRQNKEWQDQGHPPFTIAVNISIHQLQKRGFTEKVIQILKETGLAPEYLELELTESVFMRYMNTAHPILESLKEIGVKVSLDDFGTGYSSLSYLKHLPINTLKVDKSFVSDIETDREKAITGAIILLGHQLNMEIVAEGVETCRQFEFLSTLGCDKLQGSLFSKPLNAHMLTEMMAKGNVFFSIFDLEAEQLRLDTEGLSVV